MAFYEAYKKWSIRSKQLLAQATCLYVFPFDTHQETTDVAFMVWRFFSLFHFFLLFSRHRCCHHQGITEATSWRDECETSQLSSSSQRYILLFLSDDKMHCNKMSENVKSARTDIWYIIKYIHYYASHIYL